MPSNPYSAFEFSCPSWCAGDHVGQDLPSDRYHRSEHLLVPVVIPACGDDGERARLGDPGSEATEFSLQASLPVSGDPTVWVAIVGERQYIDVTLESAARLHYALEQLLDRVRHP